MTSHIDVRRAVKMLSVSVIVTALVAMAVVAHCEECVPTSGEDILEAALHSYYVGYSDVKVGDRVKGAENYFVTKVKHFYHVIY